MRYRGLNGVMYDTVEPAMNKGAEGSIHKISGRTGLVMKVIHPDKRGENRHRKLQVMLRHPLDKKSLNQITWPMDIVYDVTTGDFAGYVMRELNMTEMVSMDQIYSGKYNLTLKENIILAKNICTTFSAVHKAGYAVGDARPDNIMVSLRTLEVTLVDSDSFHVTDPDNGRIFRCEGGRPEWLPAEVQVKMRNGYDLVTAPLPTFSIESDLFALSCHCFALLMNYAHPFCCAVGGSYNMLPLSIPQPSMTVPKQHDAIYDGFTPYFMTSPGLKTPVYAPDFNYLPNTVKEMFRRAFVDGHTNPKARPTAEELKTELNRLQRNLIDCSVNPKEHQHPAGSSACPWCELENRAIPKPPKGTPSIRTRCRFPSMRYRNSCGALLLTLFLGFAMIAALPVACTANLIETENREQAYRAQQAAEHLAQIEADQTAKAAEEAAERAAEEALLAARPKGSVQAQSADSVTFSDSLSDSHEDTVFILDIPREGTYLAETTDTDLNLKIEVSDETGYVYSSWLSDTEGDICYMNLVPGRYTLRAERQFADAGRFNLKFWYQKPVLDISNYNQVYDVLEFCGQSNVYKYSCSQTGEYHILISEMNGNLERVSMEVKDAAGNVMHSDWGGTLAGFGPYLDFTEGSTYYFTVSTYMGQGNYTLAIE